MTRRRLDAELVRRGLVASRSVAAALIAEGRVRVSGSIASKPARMTDAGEPILIEGDGPRFVGRGGEKLEAALEGFGLDVAGADVLDAGASTGGFTDCLLQRGAEHVVALDVGHAQLHERLRRDPRVEVVERTNIRHVPPAAYGHLDAVVADLSFISLTVVMESLVAQLREGGWMVLLVKPQFEAGRRDVSKGRGVISDPHVWREAVLAVVRAAERCGAAMMDVMVSPLRGADGNVEFLAHFVRGAEAAVSRDTSRIDAAIDTAVAAAAQLTGATWDGP